MLSTSLCLCTMCFLLLWATKTAEGGKTIWWKYHNGEGKKKKKKTHFLVFTVGKGSWGTTSSSLCAGAGVSRRAHSCPQLSVAAAGRGVAGRQQHLQGKLDIRIKKQTSKQSFCFGKS